MNDNNISLNESESMTMTTEKSEVRVMFSCKETITIFWGDGNSETFDFKKNGGSKDFWGYYMGFSRHIYADKAPHTIIIIGGDISSLECSDNGLTDLDVSKNKDLKILSCHSNQLNKLDLSKNTRLWDLDCANNRLNELDLSNNTALSDINCRNNLLTSSALNHLFEGLHRNDVSGRYPYDEDERTIIIDGNIGLENCGRDIAMKKGWRVIG